MRSFLKTSTQALIRVFAPTHSFLFIVVLLTLALFGAPKAEALVFDVDRTDDDGSVAAQACTAAPNDCSLRGAIITANASAGVADTINLQATTYTLGPTASTCEDAAV